MNGYFFGTEMAGASKPSAVKSNEKMNLSWRQITKLESFQQLSLKSCVFPVFLNDSPVIFNVFSNMV